MSKPRSYQQAHDSVKGSSHAQQTKLLILRKTPYSNSSLIIAGISPKHGQLHFFIQNGQKIKNSKFPSLDIFKEISIIFKPTKGDSLNKPHEVELLQDYTPIAKHYPLFETAAWLAQFTIKNSTGNLECPLFYQAFTNCLQNFANSAKDTKAEKDNNLKDQNITATLLCYLYEYGYLPDFSIDPHSQKQCEILISAILNRCNFPNLKIKSWQNIKQWTYQLLNHANLTLPPINLP